jgi:ElaB/YqjD/DUF883 family membrane-anchored ribosome-binding protein
VESTFDGTAEQARAAGRRLKNDLNDGVSDIKAAASGEIKNLIADVEDLMARITDLKDADVVRVRGKVQRAVDATKQSLSGQRRCHTGTCAERGRHGRRLRARQPVAGGRHRRLGGRRGGDSSDPPSVGYAVRCDCFGYCRERRPHCCATWRPISTWSSLDIARTSQRELAAEFWRRPSWPSAAVRLLSMGCLAVVACTWDTPLPRERQSPGWAADSRPAVAAAALPNPRPVREKSRMLESVRRQWQQDRVLLESILSDQD